MECCDVTSLPVGVDRLFDRALPADYRLLLLVLLRTGLLRTSLVEG
jgi:hypothetical protein